jgi:hypothetical protein
VGVASLGDTVTDTLWADISSYQGYVDFTKYPYRVLAVRSNDGTYDDPHFVTNLAVAKHALDTGHLDLLGIYCVYRPNWQQTLANLEQNVGQPHPRSWYMIDVESWQGQVTGNQTPGIEGMRKGLAAWLNTKLGISNGESRVVVYGNAGDLQTLYPGRLSWVKIVLANYSGNPAFPGKWAHQFSSSFDVPPFGKCDINSADGRTVTQVAASLGITLTPPTPPPPSSSTTGIYHSYAKEAAKVLLSADENVSLWLGPDGRLEIRKNHQHFAWVTTQP